MASSNLSNPAFYRAYQFFVALKAYLPSRLGGGQRTLSPADMDLIDAILPQTAQQQLFERMSANDRRHALAVARALQQAGHQQPALLQAALLHDVAKCLGQPIGHRVLIVLLEAFWPALLKRLSYTPSELSIEQLGRWRRPFVIHARHAEIGAQWAAAVACEPVAIDLIARHQERLEGVEEDADDLLAALQWADNLN